MSVARRIVVAGRVQGVFFRAWTRDQAIAHGVTGWVRNRSDGSVEAHFEGEEDAVDAMIAAMHDGPPAARVQKVDVREAEPESLSRFEVRH